MQAGGSAISSIEQRKLNSNSKKLVYQRVLVRELQLPSKYELEAIAKAIDTKCEGLKSGLLDIPALFKVALNRKVRLPTLDALKCYLDEFGYNSDHKWTEADLWVPTEEDIECVSIKRDGQTAAKERKAKKPKLGPEEGDPPGLADTTESMHAIDGAVRVLYEHQGSLTSWVSAGHLDGYSGVELRQIALACEYISARARESLASDHATACTDLAWGCGSSTDGVTEGAGHGDDGTTYRSLNLPRVVHPPTSDRDAEGHVGCVIGHQSLACTDGSGDESSSDEDDLPIGFRSSSQHQTQSQESHDSTSL